MTSRLRQLVPIALMGVSVLWGTSILACADIATEPMDAGPSSGDDGGGFFAIDGAAVGSDGAVADAAAMPPDLAEADCFDFLDDDGDGATDCNDLGCGVAPVCCALGSNDASCCTPAAPLTLDLTACSSGDDARSCAGGVVHFGNAPFAVQDDTSSCHTGPLLVPGADELADTGMVLSSLLDPAVARIELSFVLGEDPAAESGRLARAGVGIVADGPVGGRVLPILSVITSGRQLRVMVGEAEVYSARFATLGDCPSALPLRLVLDPTGAFELFSGTTRITGGAVQVVPRARALVYGRHDGGSPAAWVGDVAVQRNVCSRVAPERSAAPVLVGAAPGSRLGRVSIARSVPGTLGRAAIELNGRILPATEIEGGVQVDDLVNPMVPTGAPAAMADWSGGVSDPHLVSTSGGYQLFFAGLDADGSSNIFGMAFDTELSNPRVPVSVLTVAGAAAVVGEVVLGIDEPAYYQRGGHEYLLFRATTASGTSLWNVEISVDLTTASADTPAPTPAGREALYADGERGELRRSGLDGGFDRDEIGGARVLDVGDGVLRIFYAGRRGTRWSIGALVTTDLVHYQRIDEGAAVLGPSGVGFDALGAYAPEPLLGPVAAGTATLSLYYTGTAGTSSGLGLAVQSIHVGAP